MLKMRISYTKPEDLQIAIKLLEKKFEIISLNEDHKSKNPKYENSKYKLAYVDIEKKEV